MVKLDKIYTRGGDKGQTSLVGGERVSKNNDRVIVCGNVDETNSILGLAIISASPKIKKILLSIQNDLFDLGADIANPNEKDELALRIINSQVVKLEREIDDINSFLTDLSSFVLPGGSLTSSYLHLARTVCRRSERSIVKLTDTYEINPFCLQYLNRLSDLLFVMARYENEKGKNDILWQPGRHR
ncbi:MAG: Cob(I)yrinic acid a,c-diamide adenosyltransferase [Alphaproteobacteria bacterium MarineAlpha2_Bin1]|nr:MAG: Cob(I)yrinic acid a,c-diamide adenosyltransferase [Alphaproteobacteria bacterium MarineAlpha2_Bin1]